MRSGAGKGAKEGSEEKERRVEVTADGSGRVPGWRRQATQSNAEKRQRCNARDRCRAKHATAEGRRGVCSCTEKKNAGRRGGGRERGVTGRYRWTKWLRKERRKSRRDGRKVRGRGHQPELAHNSPFRRYAVFVQAQKPASRLRRRPINDRLAAATHFSQLGVDL